MRFPFLGFPPRLVQAFRDRQKLMTWARRTASRPVITPPKAFVPKCPNLIRLESYEGIFPIKFWDEFPKYRPSTWDPESWIDGGTLLNQAKEAGVDNLTNAMKACSVLEQGANTG